MRNEVIWLIYIIVNYSLILLAYRLWGKVGLFISIPLSIILANIQVLKLITLFGISATMGNIAYSGVFIVDDILSENYGQKVAKKGVAIGFFCLIFTTLVMSIALKIIPASEDTYQPILQSIFSNFGRLTVASLVAYVISSLTDIYLFQLIKKSLPSFKNLYIRNNVSTLFSQVVDSVVFVIIAFYGVYDNRLLFEIAFSTYFLKVITSFADTPFVYLATYFKRKNKIIEL